MLSDQGWYRIAATDYYKSQAVAPALATNIYLYREYYRAPSELQHLEVLTCYIKGTIKLISQTVMFQIIKKARLVLRNLPDGRVYWAIDIFWAHDSDNPIYVTSESLPVGRRGEKGFAAIRPGGTVELDESIDTVVHEINLTE